MVSRKNTGGLNLFLLCTNLYPGYKDTWQNGCFLTQSVSGLPQKTYKPNNKHHDETKMSNHSKVRAKENDKLNCGAPDQRHEPRHEKTSKMTVRPAKTQISHSV